MRYFLIVILCITQGLLLAQSNQPFFAARAIMPDAAQDLGSDLYRVELTIIDQTAVYDGLDIAADSTFFLITQSGITGDDINLYPVKAINIAFAGVVTVDVQDIDAAGAPTMGSQVLCEQSPSGLFAYVSGAGDPLNQAISDYNLNRVQQEFATRIDSIEEGTNITFSGTGTNADPLIINAEAAATASNGLSIDGVSGDVELGGTLSGNTTILGGAYDFRILSADEIELDATTIRAEANNIYMGRSGTLDLHFPATAYNDINAGRGLDIFADDAFNVVVPNSQGGANALGFASSSLTNRSTINSYVIIDTLGFIRPGFTNSGPGSELGMIAYNPSTNTLATWNGSQWGDIGGSTGGSAFWEDNSGTVRTVSASSGLDIVFGSSQLDNSGTSTEDQRFFFDNSKGAFYAGEWTSTEADDANRGFNSVNLTRNAITSAYTSASIGGEGNDIDGSGSVAVACDDCIADGSSANSVLTGKDARSTLENDHVHGGGGDLNLGHHQYRRLVAWKDHTGTGTAVMHLNGTNADLVIPNNTVWAGQCECSAIVKTAGTGTNVGDHKFYQGRFVAKNIAGSTSVQFINTTDALLDSPSFNSSTMNLAADDTNDALTVLILSIPGSVTSITHITCTLHITETGY